jgi:hypothetical protein
MEKGGTFRGGTQRARSAATFQFLATLCPFIFHASSFRFKTTLSFFLKQFSNHPFCNRTILENDIHTYFEIKMLIINQTKQNGEYHAGLLVACVVTPWQQGQYWQYI